MGSSGGTSTSTTTMDPMQSQYLSQYIMPAAERIGSMEFTPYEGERVAGLSDLESQAVAGYGGLSLPSEYQAASDVYSGVAQRTPQERMMRIGEIQEQMAPMLNRKFAQQGVGQEAQAIKAGAFGDRRDVYEGERQAALEANAFNLASQELQRRDASRLGAAQGMMGAAQGRQAADLQRLGAQMGAGATARGVDQDTLNKAYEAYLMEQQFPLTQFSALTGGSASFPAGIGTTSGSSTTRDPMGNAGALMSGAGNLMYGMSFLSDVRLKDDIVHEDTRNGVKFYSWTWNKDAQSKGLKGRSYGVIAQEVEEIYPHLVEVGSDGYRRVKYSDLYKEIGDTNVIV